MAIHPKLRSPRGLKTALFPLVLWACSSGGEPGGDSTQPIGGSKDPPAMSPDGAGAPGVGGSDAEPDERGGDTGAGDDDAPPPDETPTGGKAGQGDPDSKPDEAPDRAGDGGGGAEPEPEPEPSDAFLRGKALAEQNQCVTCHQANFAGFTVFPNITPDVETGIGTWTDEQIVAALRDGKAPDGSSLCTTMQRYAFTDDEAADMVAFLRGLPAVSNPITIACP